MNKHKWYNEIVAWAEGKPIQYKIRNKSVWNDWQDSTYSNIPSFNGDIQFRVKPNTVKYRLYLDGLDGDIVDNIMIILSSDDNLSETVMKVESFNSTFIRWLTDWIELEIGDIK